MPLSKIYIKVPYIWEIILYYIIIFCAMYIYKKYGKKYIILKIKILLNKVKEKNKKIIIVILILILTIILYNSIPKDLRIYFIDVGQGDSTLIVTPYNKTILIDGGGSENYNVGEQVLLPYLLSRRITKIDYIICSHFDTDHIRPVFLQ